MRVEPDPACIGHYWNGCRCGDCRSWNTEKARERRERRRNNITAPSDFVPVEPAREAILQMRGAGMTWQQIALLAASERTTVQNVIYRHRKVVTRSLSDRLVFAASAVAEHPEPVTLESTMVDATFTRWMVSALMAHGWTSSWIGRQIGWGEARCTPRDVAKKRVHLDFEAKVRAVFDEYAYQQGPSQQTAMTTLRKGQFPADCYNWEDRDYRPVPGSLHPELVQLAAKSRDKARSRALLARMAELGQWPNERCARTSMHLWAEATGRTIDTDYSDIYIHPGRSLLCRSRRHDHAPPAIWTTGTPDPAIAS